MGWIGLRSEIYDALAENRQSQAGYGEYEFRGDIIFGLCAEEVVLGENAEYKAPDCGWRSLTELMQESDYGSSVHVVC